MALRITTYCFIILLVIRCGSKQTHNGVEVPDLGIWADSCEVKGVDFNDFVLSSQYGHASDSLSGFTFNRESHKWEQKMGLSYLSYLENESIDSLAPVVNVSWEDACAYCNAKKGRLPTAEEWEELAKDDEVPGNIWEGYFPTKDEGKDGYKMSYAPVNEFNASDIGLYNLRGNVWEWTSTSVAGSYLIKGGSFLTDYAQGGFLPGVKVAVPPNSVRCDLGFRCVYDR